jgi:hypothetical protein
LPAPISNAISGFKRFASFYKFSALNAFLFLPIRFELMTFEPLGKRREEFGEAEGRMATERAGASESTITHACTIELVTN